MGVYGATIGVAVAIGPLIGGALTDGLGWQSIFYLNVPIGAAALALTYLRLRESRDPARDPSRLGRRHDLQRRPLPARARALQDPLLLRRPAGGLRRLGLALRDVPPPNLYLQNYLGYSPFQTGLRYLLITVLAFLFSAGVGARIGRVPARLLLSAGLAMTGTGLLLMSGIKVRVGMDDAARRLSRRRRGHRRPGLRRRHAWKRTNAQRLSDRGTHELLAFQRRELNPPNAAWEPIDHLRRRAQCEPRLAAAPSTSQGDQTVGPQRALQFIQLAPAAHEASQQVGKIVRPRVAQQQ